MYILSLPGFLLGYYFLLLLLNFQRAALVLENNRNSRSQPQTLFHSSQHFPPKNSRRELSHMKRERKSWAARARISIAAQSQLPNSGFIITN